jgi:hypothetical protein
MNLCTLNVDQFTTLNVDAFDTLETMSTEGRRIVWNSETNVIPVGTPPTLTVTYAPNRQSATITMSCDVIGATIKYCTNGRYATTHANSPIYTGPITVTQSKAFHACWYFNGFKSRAAHASIYLKT